MLNEGKVRIMTKLALYETHEGKDDIKLSKYYRTDYARLQVLKTSLCVTLAYLLCVALYATYNLEYFVEEAVKIDWAALGKKALGIYILIMAVYILSTLIGYSLYYSYSRKKLSKYFKLLRKLKHFYDEEGGTPLVTELKNDDYMISDEDMILSEADLRDSINSLEKDENSHKNRF